MSSFTKVNSCVVSSEKDNNRPHISYLIFQINGINYFRFPCYSSKINTEIINNFKHILEGKERDINLNFYNNYNLIMFEKEFLTISLLNENTSVSNLIQEFKICFENNSIIRNSLRLFIDEFEE